MKDQKTTLPRVNLCLILEINLFRSEVMSHKNRYNERPPECFFELTYFLR